MAGWRTYREQHGRGIERNASEESSDFLLFQNQLEPKSGGQPVDGLLPKLRGEAIAKTTSQPPVSTALGAASPKSRIENVVALVYTRTGYQQRSGLVFANVRPEELFHALTICARHSGYGPPEVSP